MMISTIKLWLATLAVFIISTLSMLLRLKSKDNELLERQVIEKQKEINANNLIIEAEIRHDRIKANNATATDIDDRLRKYTRD